MKNTLTLCFSIFKGNKGFSIGLLLLFFFGATLIVMSSILPATIINSLNRFLDDYNMSQANIVTEPISVDVNGFDTSIEGVKSIESQMVLDTFVKISENEQKAMRIFTIEDDGFRKYYFNEKIDANDGEKTVWVTSYFANVLNIHAGDMLEVKLPYGFEKIKISSIVSSPESISCCFDDTFWCEDYDFGHIFMSRADFEDLYKIKGLSNSRSFLFDEGISVEKKDKAINKACEILGNNVVSSEIYERSKAKNIIDSNMDSLRQACDLFPYMTFAVLIICSYLFLYQTINNQRKKIGLLRALGYTSRKVMMIYVVYILVITTISVILGIIAGVIFNGYVIEEYKLIFSIPKTYYLIPHKTYLLLIVLFTTGVISCLFSSRSITKIDPSEAYSSNVVTTMPYKFKSPLFKHMNVFTKIAISKIFKNKKRLLMLSTSVAACIILSYMSIACIHSKNASNDATFGNRLNYDLLVYFDDENICDEILSMNEVSKIQKSIVFTESLFLNDKDLNLQYNAIFDDSEMVAPKNIKGERVYPEDGIVMEQFVADYFGLKIGDKINVSGVDLKINDIACEYVNYIEYISYQTAHELGFTNSNAAFICLNDNVDTNVVFNRISEMDGFKYMKFLKHQQYIKMENQRALDLVYYAIIFMSIFIGLIIIVNMVVISVRERKFEYGTLLALGTDNSKFVSMIFIENLLQYIFASFIAFIPCYFLADLVLNSMASAQQDFPFVDIFNVYIESFTLALIYIIVGVIYTLIRIRKINPAITLNIRE